VKTSIRYGALACALAAGSAVVVPLALPASAAALKPSVSCKSESSPPLAAGKVTSTVSKCTPAALSAGGTSTTKTKAGSTSGQVISTTVWKGGKGTTAATIKYAGAKTLGKCKAPYDTRVTIKGTVNKSTGAAAAIVKKGEAVTASICAIAKAGKSQGKTILEPGTAFKL
jgi:hypothetical protein